MKWFDPSTQRYMEKLSKDADIEAGMVLRVYIEHMTPEDAIVDLIVSNLGLISAKECITAWNRIVYLNMVVMHNKIRLFFMNLILSIIKRILT